MAGTFLDHASARPSTRANHERPDQSRTRGVGNAIQVGDLLAGVSQAPAGSGAASFGYGLSTRSRERRRRTPRALPPGCRARWQSGRHASHTGRCRFRPQDVSIPRTSIWSAWKQKELRGCIRPRAEPRRMPHADDGIVLSLCGWRRLLPVRRARSRHGPLLPHPIRRCYAVAAPIRRGALTPF